MINLRRRLLQPSAFNVLIYKYTIGYARVHSLTQNCRCMSKKVIIRWPKAFPSLDETQTSKKKFNGAKRHKDNHFHKSFSVVDSAESSPRTNELLDEFPVDNGNDDFEGVLMSKKIDEVADLDESESSGPAVHWHFSETDVGMSGTFIVKGRNTDRVVEDLKTSHVVDYQSSKANCDVEVNAGEVYFNERLQGEMINRGASSSLEDNWNALTNGENEMAERFSCRTLSKVDDFNEGTRKSNQGGTTGISSDLEESPTDQSTKSDETEVTHLNYLEKSKSWKEKQLLKRQNQSKQQQRRKKSIINPKNEVLFGVSPCLLALLQNRRQITNAFVLEAFKISARPEAQEIMKMLNSRGVTIHVRSRGELNRLSQDRPHQGVCLEVSRLHFENLAEISGELINADSDSRICLLALDKIMDPMNLGALMRSAYFLGVDTVVANKQNCCPLTPIVSKASSGICEVMPIYSAMDMAKFIQDLGDHGWHVMGATNELDTSEGDSEKPILSCREVKVMKPTVLVIGSEGFGLRKSIQNLCHAFVRVPPGRTLHLGIDSLNVSVATGILLYSLLMNR